jgi:hypothetical protein
MEAAGVIVHRQAAEPAELDLRADADRSRLATGLSHAHRREHDRRYE